MTSIATRTVLEAYTRDVGRNVIRLDYDTMDELNLATGDAVKIVSQTKTSVAKALPLYPSDEGKNLIRIDGLMRENIQVDIGKPINLSKQVSVQAVEVTFCPLEATPPIDERYMTDALETVYVVKGDMVAIPYFGSRIRFKVINVKPDGVVCITQNTKAVIKDIDIETSEELIALENYVEERKAQISNEVYDYILKNIKEKKFGNVQLSILKYNNEMNDLINMKREVKKILYNARKIKTEE